MQNDEARCGGEAWTRVVSRVRERPIRTGPLQLRDRHVRGGRGDALGLDHRVVRLPRSGRVALSAHPQVEKRVRGLFGRNRRCWRRNISSPLITSSADVLEFTDASDEERWRARDALRWPFPCPKFCRDLLGNLGPVMSTLPTSELESVFQSQVRADGRRPLGSTSRLTATRLQGRGLDHH